MRARCTGRCRDGPTYQLGSKSPWSVHWPLGPKSPWPNVIQIRPAMRPQRQAERRIAEQVFFLGPRLHGERPSRVNLVGHVQHAHAWAMRSAAQPLRGGKAVLVHDAHRCGAMSPRAGDGRRGVGASEPVACRPATKCNVVTTGRGAVLQVCVQLACRATGHVLEDNLFVRDSFLFLQEGISSALVTIADTSMSGRWQ